MNCCRTDVWRFCAGWQAPARARKNAGPDGLRNRCRLTHPVEIKKPGPNGPGFLFAQVKLALKQDRDGSIILNFNQHMSAKLSHLSVHPLLAQCLHKVAN